MVGSPVAAAPAYSRRAGRRLAALTALVALFAATIGLSAGPALAISANEVVITRIFDGTTTFDPASGEDPEDNGTAAPAPHTPGIDSGPTNNVVRTYDLFGVQVDWDVNEDAAAAVTLAVTLSTREGEADVAWAPDQTGMFAGCGAGSTLTDVAVTMTTADGDANETSDTLETPFTVSETARGNWIKNAPTFTETAVTVDGVPGYVVLFPIGLSSATDLANPPKGSGEMNTAVGLTFYDHGWDLVPSASLATEAQIAAAADAGASIHGPACGSYDAANAGGLPVTTQTWTCGAPTTNNGYPVWRIDVSGYSNEAPEANADGTANSQG